MSETDGKHLWWSLLVLGFNPETVNSKHVNLGPGMFDKPNKDAFYLIIHFLLGKLNPTRFQETYRFCWPVLNQKMDAEFRKATCTWLREILDENVNASLLLSPGGPKFTGVMLHLVRYTLLIEMKTLNNDEGWFPQSVARPASSAELKVKRFLLVRRRFLRAALNQDDLLREHQRRSQTLAKSVRELQAESLKYNELLKRYESNQECSATEGVELVRSLSSTVDEMLATSAKGQEVLEGVLKGSANQRTLEGPARVLQIPPRLLEKIEQLPHQLHSGALYQDGQLNLLGAMELMNHSLQLLKAERHGVSNSPKLELSSCSLQNYSEQMTGHLQDLRLTRQKISKEEIPEVQSSIRELEAEWDRKWTELLKETPLVSFLSKDSVPGLLSPISQLSFEPLTETSSGASVFSLFAAKLLEKSESQDGTLPSSLQIQSGRTAALSQPAVAEPSSPRVNSSLDFIFNTPPSPPLKTQSVTPIQVDPMCLTPDTNKTKTPVQKLGSTRTKSQILDLESDNLANQFAEAVMISPKGDKVPYMDLEDILCNLRDPFSTRKRLLRTPESLIQDVRDSWRKAVGSCEAKKQNTSELNESLGGRLQPIYSLSSPESPDRCPTVNPQEAVKSTLFWETTGTDSLDGSAVPFSLDLETLPEMSSCDSLLSLGEDDYQIDNSPPAQTPARDASASLSRTPQTGYFRTSDKCLTDSPGLDTEWVGERPSIVEPSSNVFSLDLDSLDLRPSTPSDKQEYSLPKLITFSPIDDEKCSL
ncbi:HAUS augmin-like complex subunit 6 [Neosynchiropus ocellatus]